MNTQSLIYFLIFIIVFFTAIACIILALYYRKKQDLVVKNKSKKKDFFYNLYVILSQSKVFNKYFIYIKLKISKVASLDAYELNKLTAKSSVFLLSVTIPTLFIFVYTNGDIFYKLAGIISVAIIHNEILYTIVEKTEFNLLISFEKFLTTTRHYYHEHGMIDEAVYSAIEEINNSTMELQVRKMYKVLSSEDIETDIEKYNDVVPNKFFKTFMSLAYVTLKFGDKKVNDTSMFLTNLNYLKQEINIELLKREKMEYIFKSLNVIALIPLFFMKPLESWVVGNMPELDAYFNSSLGVLVQLISFVAIFMSYILIYNMKKSTANDEESTDKIYKRLLKISFVSRFIKSLINNNYTKSEKVRILLKQSGIRKSVEIYYLRRLITFVVVFVVSILAFANIYELSKTQILKSYDDYLTIKNIKSQAEIELQLLKKDIMYDYKGKRNFKEETLKEGIKAQYNKNISDEMLEKVFIQVSSDIKEYQNLYFKWYNLILCIVISYLSTHIQYLIILFKRKMLQMSLEDEVMQFQSIILMIMYIDRIDVLGILTWLEQFSSYFKDSITVCINNYSKGDTEALEKLKVEEPYIPFTRIVDNLISACDKIPIKRAFEELVIERNFYKDKRKQDNEIMINKKEAMGKLIAFTPVFITITLYLIVPFMMLSIEQLQSFTNQLQEFM